ncbi:MAG: hypothetical protein VX988_01635 [Planctomycetota bacterium]|nr:hypothetical protein [Planctomycetota bacterium]
MDTGSPITQTLEPLHLVPSRQPNQVRDLASSLLAHYHVESGTAHLAGCTLDDVPVVRVSWNDPTGEASNTFIIFEQANEAGRFVDSELFATLGLSNLMKTERPTAIPPREVDRLVTAAIKCAGTAAAKDNTKPNAVALIWCKYARVKIRFTTAAATAETSFADWANTIKPMPFRCAISGTDTFSVAATSDQRIVAADQLNICQQSGQRLPRTELMTSAVSGKLISRSFATTCPVTGESILPSEMVPCGRCGEGVSPNAISATDCLACRSVSPIRKDDTRLIKIVARHPHVAQWKWFRLSETRRVYILMASGFFQQRLFVLDRDTIELRRVLKGTRLSNNWAKMDCANP